MAGSGFGTPIRLAIVDRDSGFVHVLGKRVEARGWEQRVLSRPPSVEQLVALRLGALVIDLALLGADGWDYLERVRAALPSLPLVVCSGGAGVTQRVRGLRLGADDWLAKPCHPEELIARIEAIVRRMRVAAAGEDGLPGIDTGELQIRRDRFQAYVGEKSLNLTRREFEMLCLLAAHAGCVLEREAIYQHVWGYAMARGDRSVDVFVRKLRSKLERGSRDWRYIHTHFGVGYRFEPLRADEVADEALDVVTPRAAGRDRARAARA
jgi:DNA-binding response OmpR family regulator